MWYQQKKENRAAEEKIKEQKLLDVVLNHICILEGKLVMAGVLNRHWYHGTTNGVDVLGLQGKIDDKLSALLDYLNLEVKKTKPGISIVPKEKK